MNRLASLRYPLLVSAILIPILALVFSPISLQTAITRLKSIPSTLSPWISSPAPQAPPRTPVYFLSHGGPDVMYNTTHPVYPVLQAIGKEITEKVKPKAVVVFSAHWTGKPDSIQVNNAEQTDLIYDFYGFPDYFYKAQYPNRGSPELAQKIIDLLGDAGIKATGTKRGLDHGVWAGFHVAFHPDTNPLAVPLVQVSLFHSEDPDQHYRLGRAVAPLREQGIVIIAAGMSVHNLRDMGSTGLMPYAVSFDNALKEAVEAAPRERQGKMAAVCARPDAKQAHPWMDHLMPVHVAAGAAGDDVGKQTWTLQEKSFAWAQYRFGEPTAT